MCTTNGGATSLSLDNRGYVFIRFQYDAFTELALIILQLHQNHEGDSTHKGVISRHGVIVIGNTRFFL